MVHQELVTDIEAILQRLEVERGDHGDFQQLHAEFTEVSQRLRHSLEALKLSHEETAAALALAEGQRRRYVALFDCAPDGYLVTDDRGIIQEANRAACRLFGCDAGALSGAGVLDLASPTDAPRLRRELAELRSTSESSDFQLRLRRATDSWFTASVSVAAARDEPSGFQVLRWILHDVSERDLSERLLQSRNRVLRRMADGADLSEVLTTLTETLEDVLAETRCSVLLVEGDRLRHGAAPSLPDFYNEAVDGIGIAHGVGSCGAAAASATRVVVEDVLEHPNWSGFRELARRAGIRSCWSEPIISASGTVLGTFAMYYREPRHPEAADLRIIKVAAQVAGIAIENAANQRARQRLEAQLRQVIDLVPHMIFVKDWSGRFLLANRALADAYGTTVEDLTGRGHAELHSHPLELERMLAHDQEVMRSGEPKIIPEETFRDDRGEERILQTIKIPYTAVGDDTPAVLGVATDITLLKQAQVALEEANEVLEDRVAQRTADLRFVNHHLKREVSERRAAEQALGIATERLNHVLSWSPTILYTLALEDDLPTTFVSANVEQILGYLPERLTYDRSFWAAAVHPEDRERFFASRTRPLREGLCSAEYRIRHADGAWLWFEDQRRVVRDSSGEPLELVGSILDITTRKELESELRLLQDEIAHACRISTAGELSTMIVHELNQPLTTIVNISEGCLEALRSGGARDPELPSQLERLAAQALRAAETIRHIRGFVKKRELRLEPQALGEIVAEAALLLGPEAQHAAITLECDLADELPLVVADRIQIEQVVVNLVRNAIESLKDHEGIRRILVSTRATAEGMVQVEVTDSGPGLSDQEAEQAFHPFFTTKEDGTGLGLAISRTIVEAHGGTLVIPPHDGPGATFRFNLAPAD